MSECNHDFSERESSVATEGYCPICMAEDNKRLRELNGELIQALKELLQYIDDHDWGTIPEGETADRARAAIAKATGGK